MDVLTDILASLRLTGGVVIDGDLRGDFCVLSQFTPDHCAPFFPMPETLIAYHYVRSGRMLVEVEGHAPVEVFGGSVAIVPRNEAHLLASRAGLQPMDSDEVRWVTEGGVHKVDCGTDGPATRVWCGFLGASRSDAHPLLAALPPVLTLDLADGQGEWLDSSMRFVAEHQPSPEVVARLAELFLAQAIRRYVEIMPANSQGWLRGLTDPAVSRALTLIHRRYAEELDVEMLAREAGVSRSVLGEKFVELIGEPPMRYCAHWRMRVAANMLRDGKDSTANIAYSVGFNSEAAFNRAFKREFGEPPATWRRHREDEERERSRSATLRQLPPQQVQYCTAGDGTRLAYSKVGEGPPLLKTANWLNHIEFDWESPVFKHLLAELTNGHCLVRYDERGNGLSDWDTPELSLDAFVSDLETIVECAELDRFDLFGISQGVAVSIAYAIKNPGRVRRMILLGGYAAGWKLRADEDEVARREAMVTLTRTGWGKDNPAYRQMFTSLYVPGGTPLQQKWFNDLQRASASPENAVRIQHALSLLDVRHLLDKVRVPTLVMHARGDQVIPFSCGLELARKIPGARFVALEGDNHILLEKEPAWKHFVQEMRAFLAEEERVMA